MGQVSLVVSSTLGVHQHKKVKSPVGPSVVSASHNGLDLRSAAQQGKGTPLVIHGETSASPQLFLKKLHPGAVRFVSPDFNTVISPFIAPFMLQGRAQPT